MAKPEHRGRRLQRTVLLALAAAVVCAPLSTRGDAAVPQQEAPITPKLLVPLALTSAEGVAVAADGTTYVTEAARGRAFALAPDGTSTRVGGTLDHPTRVAVGPDGTVTIATATGVTLVAPDGGVRSVASVGGADGLAYTSDGTLWLTDSDDDTLRQVAADGTTTAVALSNTGDIRGLAAGSDDALYVIDEDAGDVIRRDPDGTDAHLAFTASITGSTVVAVGGDRVYVAGDDAVVARAQDGTQEVITDATGFETTQLAVLADATLTFASGGASGTRTSFPSFGGLLHLRSDGTFERIPVGGDVASLRYASVAADDDGGAAFTSWSGYPGYSDPNPLRTVSSTGQVADLTRSTGDGQRFDLAPDGTTYRTDDTALWRTGPEGGPTKVSLPTEPGFDAITALAVDDRGRAYVGLGTGYRTGGWQLVRVDADGTGAAVVAADRSARVSLDAVGAGGGAVVLLTTDASAHEHLIDLHPSGDLTERADLGPSTSSTVAVDAAGTALVADGPIVTVGIDGARATIDYVGRASIVGLAASDDGVLFVADEDLGLLALDGVVPHAGTQQPEGPPAAVPVAGTADFTG